MKKVIVECKPDEILVKTLGLTRNEVIHQSNKGEVCNFLKKDIIPLAIIDEDPNSAQPSYLQDFTIIEERFEVKLLRHKKDKKTILILKPRLEEWILKRCRETAVKPETHFLPSNNKELKDVINYHLPKFENLLKNLLLKNDAGLNYLKVTIDKI